MKEGWNFTSIGELCIKLTDGSHNPPKGLNNTSPYRMLSSQNIFDDSLDFTNVRYLTEDDFNVENKRTSLQKGDVLLTIVGSIGRCTVLNSDEPITLQRSVAVIRPKDTVVSRYLMHALIGSRKRLEQEGHGIAQKGIYLKQLSDFCVYIPSSKDLQQRIADELDLLNGIIKKKNEQLKILDKLAESIFYEMFGDPVANEKGWKTNKMNAVAPQKAFTGNIPSVNGRYWLLNLDMVESQTGKILEKVMFTPSEIGNSISSFNEENILYSKLRPYLNKVVIPTEPGYCTSELVPLLPKKGVIERTFLTYLIRSKFFVEYINSRVAGAKMPRVSMSDFRDFDVILPPLEQQQLFSDKIAVIDKQKSLIEDSLKPAKNLLASRMDKYFSE